MRTQDGIPAETEKIFIDRVLDGKALSFPIINQARPEDPKLAEVWMGNRPNMKSSVSKVVLSFTQAAGAGEKQGTFDFEFEFQQDGFVIKHSNPYYASEKSGFRVGNEKAQKLRKFYFRGKDKSSLIVSIPSFANNERSRGALLCPRDFLRTGSREEKASLQYTGYELNAASAEVKSEANAYLKNPVDYVLAQANILVTPGVMFAQNFEDKSYAKDASVALEYKAHKDGKLEKFDEFSNIALGIENFISLHFASGFRRITKQKALVYAKKILLSKGTEAVLQGKDVIGTEMETEMQLRGKALKNQTLITANVKPGACYLVLYQVTPIIHEYLKQDFVIPKEFHETEEQQQNTE